MTLYTRHRGAVSTAGAARLLRAFVACVPEGTLAWLFTSHQTGWLAVRPRELDGIAAGIERADAPRHLFSLRVAERVDAAETFFAYREVDASRGGAGYLQLGLPLSHTPQRLLQLAELASQEVPMWWGSAGFLASGHPSDPCTSLSAHWAWSRRYQGIDVHDLERRGVARATALSA